MPTLTLPTQPATVRTFPVHDRPPQQRHVHVLVVSPELEIRQALFRALEDLSLDVTVCSNLAQAADVISRQVFELIFSDWHLPDGSFTDLAQVSDGARKNPRIVVMVRATDRETRLEGLSKGAFAVVRWPGCATDVEMAIIRAIREENRLSLFPPAA